MTENDALIDDCALMTGRVILEVIGPCLFAEDGDEALRELAAVCKAGIEAYLLRARRGSRRDPSSN